MRLRLGPFGRRPPGSARSDGDDRRLSCRYPAADNEARLGWWTGATFHESPAQLLDISQGGARVRAAIAPPTPEVFLRLARPVGTPWMPAVILRARAGPRGSRLLGIRFPEGCPYALFRDLQGCRLQDQPDDVSAEFDPRLWR